MDNSKNKHNQHLGVNRIGKNITKNPFHHPNFVNPTRQPSHPQVYNINKNDFRNIVQQLTSQEPLLRTPQNPIMRLQRIRPPPLSPPRTGLLPPPAMNSGDHRAVATTMDSPVSSYMRYLQHSIMDSTQSIQQQSSGLLPNPSAPPSGPQPLLPSPTSQFLLSLPRSPYPLHTPPLTPNVQLLQSGILGPGPQSLPVSSPRWRG